MKILYTPSSKKPHKLSRSKIDLFLNCPRCFYLDQRSGVKRPSGPPFTLNAAVDHLLKQEFDAHRARGTQHPLMKHYKLDAVPAPHPELVTWRHNFTGVQYLHQKTNLLVYGAIDDLWQNKHGEYIIVDYKATAKAEIVTELSDASWHDSYRRQMEIYQWLVRKNGLTVSDTGYFVYCTGRKDKKAFDKKLEFEVVLIPYTGSDAWIEKTILAVKRTLQSATAPPSGAQCAYCTYRADAQKALAA